MICAGGLATGPGLGQVVPPSSQGREAVINVLDYGAKGDGIADDTGALLRAISQRPAPEEKHRPRQPQKIVFLPAGVYLVSDTLLRRSPDGKWLGNMRLVGEGRDATVIRLRDGEPGFGDSSRPKPVVQTASFLFTGKPMDHRNWPELGEGNEAYGNYVADLTIDVGSANPGAIGLDFLANNGGAVRGVTIRSGDGRGKAGLSMTRRWPGPALISDLTVEGFDYGIAVEHAEYGMTLEHITLRDQRLAGIRNSQNALSIRDLRTRTKAHAIENLNNGLVAILDGSFDSGLIWHAAIRNHGKLYLRNVTTTGYRSVIEGQSATAVREYVSDPIPGSRRLPREAPRIPVEDTPQPPPDPSAWASVTAFGANPLDFGDDRAAIQAAIDSGATTVYFPTGRYFLSGPIQIRGNVRRLVGMMSLLGPTFRHPWTNALRPVPVFDIAAGAREAVWIEDIYWSGDYFTQSPAVNEATQTLRLTVPRTVVLKDVKVGGTIYASNGRLFIENICCPPLRLSAPNRTWIRQYNTEGPGLGVDNAGADLWILGIKTEGAKTVIATSRGGRTALVGGLLYPVGRVPPDLPAFTNDGSYHALTYAVSSYAPGSFYEVEVLDRFSGASRALKRSDVPRHGQGSIVPFWSAFPPPAGEAP